MNVDLSIQPNSIYFIFDGLIVVMTSICYCAPSKASPSAPIFMIVGAMMAIS